MFGENRAQGLKTIVFWYAGIMDAEFRNNEIELLDALIPAIPKHTGKTSMRDDVLHRSLLVEVCCYTLNRTFDQDWCHNFAHAIASSSFFIAGIKGKVTEICSHASSDIEEICHEMMDALSNYEVRELKKRERRIQEVIIRLTRHQGEYGANGNRSIANASHQLQQIQRLSYEPTTQKRNDNGFESIVNSFSNNRNQSHPTSEAQMTQNRSNIGFESILNSFHNNQNMSHSTREAQTMRNRNNNGVQSILNSFHNNRTQSHSISETQMTQNRNNNGFEPLLHSVRNDQAKLLLQQQHQQQHQHQNQQQQPPFGYERFLKW
jgi:hypothetical protein